MSTFAGWARRFADKKFAGADRSKLVQVERQLVSTTGKPFKRNYWIRPKDMKPGDKVVKAGTGKGERGSPPQKSLPSMTPPSTPPGGTKSEIVKHGPFKFIKGAQDAKGYRFTVEAHGEVVGGGRLDYPVSDTMERRGEPARVLLDGMKSDEAYPSLLDAAIHYENVGAGKRPWKNIKETNLPESTKAAHTDANGQYTVERKKLHDEIRARALDHVPRVLPGMTPTAVVMMGGPASGKSSLTKHLGDDLVRVDPDGVKDQLPEYQEGLKQSVRESAIMAHDESSDVAQSIRDSAIANRQNVLVDGTGKNAEKYEAMIRHLKARGYHVTVLMPHITADEARKRNAIRSEETGRFVPDEVITEAYEKIPKNFFRIARLADEASLYDGARTKVNAEGKTVPAPKVVWQRSHNGEKTLDPEFMKGFPPDTPSAGKPASAGKGSS